MNIDCVYEWIILCVGFTSDNAGCAYLKAENTNNNNNNNGMKWQLTPPESLGKVSGIFRRPDLSLDLSWQPAPRHPWRQFLSAPYTRCTQRIFPAISLSRDENIDLLYLIPIIFQRIQTIFSYYLHYLIIFSRDDIAIIYDIPINPP